jgi:hypothetical protein
VNLLERALAQMTRAQGNLPLDPRLNECDVIFVSFPKCGRTWLRALVGETFQQHFGQAELHYNNPVFGSAAPGMPRVAFVHDGEPAYKRASELERVKHKFRNKKIVLLVRDPRDTLVSLYFQITRRVGENKRRRAFQGSLSEYIRQPIGALETFVEYYKIWASQRHVPAAFLLVRYEDMHADTTQELRRILDWLGVGEVSPAVIQAVVTVSSFDNMHAREARGEFDSSRLTPRDSTDPESYKTRRGRVGGFVDYLSPADIEYLNQYIRAEFPPYYGYRV